MVIRYGFLFIRIMEILGIVCMGENETRTAQPVASPPRGLRGSSDDEDVKSACLTFLRSTPAEQITALSFERWMISELKRQVGI